MSLSHHGFSTPPRILQTPQDWKANGPFNWPFDGVSISLPALANDDLDWSNEMSLAKKLSEEGAALFWEIDLGLQSGPLAFREGFDFQVRMLALDHFVQRVYPEFKEKTLGVSLYVGKLDFDERIDWEEEEENFAVFVDELGREDDPDHLRALFATQLFAEYMHRLASALPDECLPYCLFDVCAHKSEAKLAQLLSKARFEHLHLGVKGSSEKTESTFVKRPVAALGIVLPMDAFCTPSALDLLDQIFAGLQASSTPYRIVPELLLTEQWDGLDKLFVVPDAVSPQGKRKLQGFLAAGGQVEYASPSGVECGDLSPLC